MQMNRADFVADMVAWERYTQEQQNHQGLTPSEQKMLDMINQGGQIVAQAQRGLEDSSK